MQMLNLLERLEAQLSICTAKGDQEGINLYTQAIKNVKERGNFWGSSWAFTWASPMGELAAHTVGTNKFMSSHTGNNNNSNNKRDTIKP